MENLTRLMRAFKSSHKAMKHCASKRRWDLQISERPYSSALYISGRRANTDFSYLSPYLDMDTKFLNINKLQEELTSRNLKVDVQDLKAQWDFYKSLRTSKEELEQKLEELASQIKLYHKEKELTPEQTQELDKLRTQMKIAKKDLRATKDTWWDLGDNIIPKILNLPNDIDQNTPLHSSMVLKEFGKLNEMSSKDIKSHIEIGRKLGLLEYKNPMQCYLCNDAALFELKVLDLAGDIFNEEKMLRVAGLDFSRSFVVEGSGLNYENLSDAFVIDNHSEVDSASVNRMHLVGGASLVSFLAMHTKQLINPINFPLKYFTTGRQYTPFREGSTPIGLFTVCQSSAVHAFVMVKDSNSTEYAAEFEKLLDGVCKLYDSLCNHYRIVARSASELRPWESKRISFELWSPFAQQYIEVGHISTCGDYFSKRLLIAYQTNTGRDFPAVISGTVLSVPRLLGCLLEQDPEKLHIPTGIRK